jgi:hypothetical protein
MLQSWCICGPGFSVCPHAEGKQWQKLSQRLPARVEQVEGTPEQPRLTRLGLGAIRRRRTRLAGLKVVNRRLFQH